MRVGAEETSVCVWSPCERLSERQNTAQTHFSAFNSVLWSCLRAALVVVVAVVAVALVVAAVVTVVVPVSPSVVQLALENVSPNSQIRSSNFLCVSELSLKPAQLLVDM